MFLISHKIEIRPYADQVEFLAQSIGCRRFIWNQCLAEWNHAYRQGLCPDVEYMRFYVKCLKEKFTWLRNVSAHILDNAIRDLDLAWKRFFKGVSKPPRFKKKGVSESFQYTIKEKFSVKGRLLRIERLKTLIPMRERVRFSGQLRQCTISSRAGRFFVSILVKVPGNPFTDRFPPSESQVGVDLGVKEFATLSDGTVFHPSKSLKRSLKKLARLQKKLSRSQKGSNRLYKLKRRVARLHYRVSCQRIAYLHNVTDFLTRNYERIIIEDLDVKGMMENHKLARAISDCGFYEFRRQLEYKAKFRGNHIVVADRWFPSTKKCSNCGNIKDMPLSERKYVCSCGLRIDRDLNASINLLNYESDRTYTGRSLNHTGEGLH